MRSIATLLNNQLPSKRVLLSNHIFSSDSAPPFSKPRQQNAGSGGSGGGGRSFTIQLLCGNRKTVLKALESEYSPPPHRPPNLAQNENASLPFPIHHPGTYSAQRREEARGKYLNNRGFKEVINNICRNLFAFPWP
jgi:hypothetical protein